MEYTTPDISFWGIRFLGWDNDSINGPEFNVEWIHEMDFPCSAEEVKAVKSNTRDNYRG